MRSATPSTIDRKALRSLFTTETRLRAVVDCVLEGHLGEIDVDDVSRPSAACLRLGCYAIFAGDAASKGASALLARSPAPIELIVPRCAAWSALVRMTLGDRLKARPMQAYVATQINHERLQSLAEAIPSGFQLRSIDATLAAQLGERLRPSGMDVMADPRDFAIRSDGAGAVVGDRLVCAATNYAFAADAIELAIATDADYRGQGLATCVAASYTLKCLERGLMPHWNASNPISKRLALRLGYRPTETVEVQYLA